MKAAIRALCLVFLLLPQAARAAVFSLSLREAEGRALSSSNQVKALGASAEGADERAEAAFAGLLPRLSLSGYYQYNTHVPQVTLPIPGMPPINFGSNTMYGIGPVLTYPLWDSGGARASYDGYRLLAQSRQEDAKNARLQALLAVRSAYLRVQLALEEERLLNDSLALARKQDRDIEANFRAGAATKLDSLEAAREVLSYQLQFEQKQSEVASDFKSLLALIVGPQPPNVARAGPKGVPNLQMELDFDPLERSLNEASAWAAQAPTDEQPALKSQELLKRSAERMADGEKAAIYPTLQFTASAMYQYPDQINLQAVEQNSLVVSLSMPIFEGDRTRHLAAEQSKQAAAAAFNREQARVSLDRDYATSVDALQSLRAQQKMAELDVERSAETARLYYESYRGGKINLIDVQSANNRALLSKVNAARIDAQALAQVYGLQAISGEVR